MKSEEGISKNSKNLMSLEFLVRVTGVEPAREAHQILSLARLPIPPYPRVAAATRGYAIADTKYTTYYSDEKVKCQD